MKVYLKCFFLNNLGKTFVQAIDLSVIAGLLVKFSLVMFLKHRINRLHFL